MSFAQVFDWENLNVGTFNSVQQTVGGITATGTGIGNQIQVINFGSNIPTFQTRSIIGAIIAGSADRVPIRVDFSFVLTQVTVQFGDASSDDDGIVTVTAYNSSNAVVDVNTFDLNTATGAHSLTVSAPDISYITGSTSGSQFPHSVLWDNMRVTPVPEPATMIALGLGIAALAARRRRKSAA